jgi:hypothetical protein
MTHFDEVAYFSEKARALSVGLSRRLDEFVNEFPAGSPSDLIKITKAFLKEIDAALDTTTSPSILTSFFRLIENLSEALNWLDNAHTAQTPKALVQSLETIAESLYSNVSLLVSPTSVYNFSIGDLVPYYRTLARGCLPASTASQLIQSFPPALYLIQFPRIEREDSCHLAIFGHEFGHPIADEYIKGHEQLAIYATRLAAAKQKIQADSVLAAKLSSISDPIEQSRLLSRLVDTVADMHRRGLEELISDAVGAYIFGPSALFASFSIFGQAPLDSVATRPLYYPPSRQRLRLILKIVDEQGQIAALDGIQSPASLPTLKQSTAAVLDHLRAISNSNSDQVAVQKEPMARIAYEWIAETLPDALTHAMVRTQNSAYSAASLSSEVQGLLERLAVDVPPNEIGTWPNLTPVDWRSGLLAAWLLTFCQQTDAASTPQERRDRVRTTKRVALKGIEYALLQNQYATHLSTKGQSP